MSVATVRLVHAASPAFAAHHALDLPGGGAELELGPERTGGSYGAIHPVQGAAGAVALLAKVFEPDALDAGGGAGPVAEMLQTLHAELEARAGADWPEAVLALPFWLADVELDGRPRLVALMLDLAARGYVAAPFADRDPAYPRRPWPERIALAKRLAERLALLTRIGLLHGDLNPENLLVDLDRGDVQVIDFDAGAMLVSGDEHPRTPGKPDECMPPEVKSTAPGRPPADPRLYTAAAERWSHGSLLGYCLLGVHPGFFLVAISPPVLEAYAAQPRRWPEIDRDGPLFTAIAVNRAAYDRMLDELRELPEGARERFAELFAAGLDGTRRPHIREWSDALAGLQRPPEVDELSVDQELVLEGDDVTIAWSVDNATHVELVPGGRRPARGELTFTARETVRVILRATNAYGEVEQRGPLVRVAPLPRLDHIGVPGFPGLAIATELPQLPLLPGHPAVVPPAFTSLQLTGAARRAAPAVPAGSLPVPPRFGDLLAPLDFKAQPRRRWRFVR